MTLIVSLQNLLQENDMSLIVKITLDIVNEIKMI